MDSINTPPESAAGAGIGIPAPVRPLGGTFTVGSLLGETFSIYFANLLPFLIISGMVLFPIHALVMLFVSSPENTALATGFRFLNFLVTPIVTAAITYGVLQQMRGRGTSVGECLRIGLPLLLPVLAVAFVQGLLIGLGVLACIIPGLILSAMYAVAVPAAVEERSGVSRSLSRSSELTEGYRWTVFALQVILILIAIALAMPLQMLAASQSWRAQQIVEAVVDVFGTGLNATAAAVMYYRLRSIKESLDVHQIASVFD